MHIRGSNKYFIIRNSIFNNTGWGGYAGGVRLWEVSNGTLENNSFYSRTGIDITSHSQNITVLRNIFINNTIGVHLGGVLDNRIINNTFINSEHIGIDLNSLSNNNSIIGNKIIESNVSIFSDPAAIKVTSGYYNRVINNTIINSLATGIRFTYGSYNIIKNNTCAFSEYGIYFFKSHYNNITANRLSNNRNDGIYLYGSSYNKISDNNLLNNSQYGINLDSNYLVNEFSTYNILYNNSFIGNNENARDWGSRSNNWNFTDFGNFWDDYSGKDENDDGIGDSPYEILSNYPKSKDYWPKWLDGPSVILRRPRNDDVYRDPPSFIIESKDPNLDIMWYTVNNSNIKYFIYDNGTVDFDAWLSLTEGNLNIKFYANDTFGNINFEEVIVFKDLSAPIINLTNPTNYTIFGSIAPNFIVNVFDLALNSTWYDLNGGGIQYLFSGSNGSLDQSAWNLLLEGFISINFYANDSFGHLSVKKIQLIKDITAPEIVVNIPHQGDLVNITAPEFIIEVEELHLDTLWYTLDNGQNIIYFTSNSTINQTLWETLWNSLAHNDEINLKFYAIDTAGNVGFAEITLVKFDPSYDPSKLAIPGFNVFVIFVFGAVSLIFLLAKNKLKSLIMGN